MLQALLPAVWFPQQACWTSRIFKKSINLLKNYVIFFFFFLTESKIQGDREIELISWLLVGFRDLELLLLLTYSFSWFINLLMWSKDLAGSTFPLWSMLVQSICRIRVKWCFSSVAVIYDHSKASIYLKKNQEIWTCSSRNLYETNEPFSLAPLPLPWDGHHLLSLLCLSHALCFYLSLGWQMWWMYKEFSVIARLFKLFWLNIMLSNISFFVDYFTNNSNKKVH